MPTEAEFLTEATNEADWEEAIIEYAIDTFPYCDDMEFLPGLEGDERDILSEMVDGGWLKIGFFYEEFQEKLEILYFLRVQDTKYKVMGKCQGMQVDIPTEVDGIFRLDDDQYFDLMQVKPA